MKLEELRRRYAADCQIDVTAPPTRARTEQQDNLRPIPARGVDDLGAISPCNHAGTVTEAATPLNLFIMRNLDGAAADEFADDGLAGDDGGKVFLAQPLDRFE